MLEKYFKEFDILRDEFDCIGDELWVYILNIKKYITTICIASIITLRIPHNYIK